MSETGVLSAPDGVTIARIEPRTDLQRKALCLMLLGAAGIPLSLIWDYSWECTIGVDLFWGPPHTAIYMAVMLAALGAICMVGREKDGIRLGFLSAPAGAWITVWGAMAFVTAVSFDRWWQGAYGLGAGIWHPPQIGKAVAFFAVLFGALCCCASARNQSDETRPVFGGCAFVIAGGASLMLISVVTITGSIPNRQHGALFYEVACASYPLPLAAFAAAGRVKFPATAAALVSMGLCCLLVWILPLFPAKPLTAPVYNSLDHMIPPSFPLLLAAPALVLDLLMQRPLARERGWLMAGLVGVAFVAVFLPVQWFFSGFLLSNAANNRFFAGGGQHWPFFLKISEQGKQAFWSAPGDDFNEGTLVPVGLLAIVSARVGLWVGEWLKGLRR
jgi:hypothetical protein